jgi:hypothetical protein
MTTGHRPYVETRVPSGTLVSQTFRQLRQFVCGLHGHDALLHFEGRHVSLVCTSCGYESPGWSLPGAPGSADRGARASAPLVRERRIA